MLEIHPRLSDFIFLRRDGFGWPDRRLRHHRLGAGAGGIFLVRAGRSANCVRTMIKATRVLAKGSSIAAVVVAISLGTADAQSITNSADRTAATGTSSPPTLTHRYSFNTDASDSVGHADGILRGAASVSDGQVHLNGTRGTYVDLPGGLIAGYPAVTFEFWATLGPNRSWARVFDQGSTNGSAGGHDLYFCPHSGRDFRLTIMDPHPRERVVTIPGNLDNQTNLYVACVLDPPSGFMGIYTNGVLAASRNDLVSLASVATNYFFLGRSLFAADAPLNGSIDEFRIYRGALNAAAIAVDYRSGPDAVPQAGSASTGR